MDRVESLLGRLNGATISDTLTLLAALHCQHDELYALTPGTKMGGVVRTTPFELSINRPGATLAAACPVRFIGGPPIKRSWYAGTLLSFTADRLLQRDADLPGNPIINLKGKCQPRKFSRENTEISGRSRLARFSADDNETVYLWSSSGQTAVRGSTPRS